MFSTLIGPFPRVLRDGTSLDDVERRVADGTTGAEVASALADELVREVIADQESAGIDLMSDGQVRHHDLLPEAVAALHDETPLGWFEEWQFAAESTPGPVKQAVPGPYSLGWIRGGRDRGKWVLSAADRVRDELRRLAVLGCPVIEVHEPEAVRIGTDEHERRLFREAHERLLDGLEGTHASLVLAGEVEPAGAETLLSAAYASFAFDLISGPDGWRVIARAPRERGIVCGVLPTEAGRRGDLALMVWAAHYAASTSARGLARVGLATAGGLRHLDRAKAVSKLARLAEAAGLAAGEPVGDLARALNRAREADHEGPDLSTATGTPRIRGLPGAPVPGRPPRAVRPPRTS